MSEKPNIKWVPSPNHSSSTKKQKTIAIVNHIMQGTLAGTDSWFTNPASGVSSHFGVGKNGEIHQYVGLDHPAWANGAVNKPNWPLYAGGNPNHYTVSIEHEGYSGDVMPEAQYQATLALHRWLVETLEIPVTRDNIIGHYRIDSVTRARCPGTGFPWDRLFKDLGGKESVIMEHAVIYFTDRDFSSARIVSDKLGGCAMYCRNGVNSNIHKDIENCKHLVIVGGAELNIPGATNCCGLHAEDTAILAAEYAKTL